MLPAPVTAAVTPLTEATGLASWAWLLIAVPAASAAFLLLAGRRSNAWGCALSDLPVRAGGTGFDLRAASLRLAQSRYRGAYRSE